jgi:hypothetical protein
VHRGRGEGWRPAGHLRCFVSPPTHSHIRFQETLQAPATTTRVDQAALNLAPRAYRRRNRLTVGSATSRRRVADVVTLVGVIRSARISAHRSALDRPDESRCTQPLARCALGLGLQGAGREAVAQGISKHYVQSIALRGAIATLKAANDPEILDGRNIRTALSKEVTSHADRLPEKCRNQVLTYLDGALGRGVIHRSLGTRMRTSITAASTDLPPHVLHPTRLASARWCGTASRLKALKAAN